MDLVKLDSVGGRSLPMVALAPINGRNPLEWLSRNKSDFHRTLLDHGAVLLRGFDFPDIAAFEEFMRQNFGQLLEYRERSSPRTRVEGNVYTSTDYPADQTIFLHNENSYQHTFPLKIAFFCATAPGVGGETPIADVRSVYAKIPTQIRNRFAEKGIMYMRNFGDELGLSWKTVFQTEDRAAVDKYCSAANIQTEWKSDGGLRTRQVRPAVARHPVSGAWTWFNHGTFFHISTLPESMQEFLRSQYSDEDLPSNTYYGDGSRIEDSVLEELRRIYQSETVQFRWEQGDLLVLENMLVAHGRAPFQGPRKIVVGMAEPHSLASDN